MKRALTLTALVLAGAAAIPGIGAEPLLQSGIDVKNVDPSIPAGKDFFEHVNEKWIEANPIPADQIRWGSFSELRERDLNQIKTIVEDLTKAAGGLDDDRRKLRDLYAEAMNENKLREQGAKALKPQFDAIEEVKSAAELPAVLADLHGRGIRPLFDFGVGIDERNSSQYIVEIGQGGLSLPERSYYVADDADSKRIREAFHAHVATMFGLLGESPDAAKASSDAVMAIETKLAEASRTPVQLRDVEKLYNKQKTTDLPKLTPDFDWSTYIKSTGVIPFEDLIVEEPEFFTALNNLLKTTPLDQLKTYLRWHLLDDTSAYLSDEFSNESFNFFGKTLRGQKEQEARWKRAVQSTDRLLGEDLGKLYVERYFPPAYRDRMKNLVANLIDAYRERIKTRDWMTDATRQQALAKLDKVMRKIAYPDKWRDYASLEIKSDAYVQDVMRARKFNYDYRLGKLGKPIDKTEWGMTPPTVNAYYNPTMNEIVFPAGILQPPFFNAEADDAVNYGGIGAVIGHELTHGFDDQGSLFDADGNLKNWWTAEDKKKFHEKADALVKQYDASVALDDLHVNGKLTLGENLADLGGLTIAYYAYHHSLNGNEAPVIDGLTGDQRFFMGFAQIWRGSNRPQSLRVRLRTDPHSPEHFRCNIPVSNFGKWYDALGIKPGDPMYRDPADRVEVW